MDDHERSEPIGVVIAWLNQMVVDAYKAGDRPRAQKMCHLSSVVSDAIKEYDARKENVET